LSKLRKKPVQLFKLIPEQCSKITGIIKYRGKLEKEFEIVKKPAELETIFILTKPEKFNPKGLKLTLNYTDESTGEVSYEGNESDFSFIPSLEELLKAGARKITVIYKGKAVYIDIVVDKIGKDAVK